MSIELHSPQEGIESAVVKMQEKFAAALPAHIPTERFVRVALSALTDASVRKIAATPAGRRSILEATLRAASDGLLLDKREAALVAYGEAVQYMPMVAGILKKARNSGEISAIVCQVVYTEDDFEINYVTDGPPIKHRPELTNRGSAFGVYAVARLKDGSWSQPEYMTFEEVSAIRQRSRAKSNGPWVTDFNEMARKTVLRRLAKYLPSSTDKDGFAEFVNRDDDPIELSPEPLSEIAPPKKKSSAAKLLSLPKTQNVDHDVETGEIQIQESTSDVDV